MRPCKIRTKYCTNDLYSRMTLYMFLLLLARRGGNQVFISLSQSEIIDSDSTDAILCFSSLFFCLCSWSLVLEAEAKRSPLHFSYQVIHVSFFYSPSLFTTNSHFCSHDKESRVKRTVWKETKMIRKWEGRGEEE